MAQLTITNTAKSEFTFFIGLYNFCFEEIFRELLEESFPPAIESHLYLHRYYESVGFVLAVSTTTFPSLQV